MIFLAMQTAFGIIGATIEVTINGEAGLSPNLSPNTIALATLFSGMFTVFILSRFLKMINTDEAWRMHGSLKDKQWWVAIVAGGISFVAGACASNLLSEQLMLTNKLEEEFITLSHSWIGIVVIGITTPIVEELIFREGITGLLLRKGLKPSIAIIASAIVFGLIHLNPAQIPFAFLLGLLLGILYWKTGNILLCGTMHIINNMVAILQMQTGDVQNTELTEMVGGVSSAWTYTFILTIVCILATIVFCKLYKQKEPILHEQKQITF